MLHPKALWQNLVSWGKAGKYAALIGLPHLFKWSNSTVNTLALMILGEGYN
jgi:hypothetical protein